MTRTTKIAIGASVLVIVAAGLGIFRFITGPSWKLPECRPSITAQGMGEELTKKLWRMKVTAAYGDRFANSGMTAMSYLVCTGGKCKYSAKPCARVPA